MTIRAAEVIPRTSATVVTVGSFQSNKVNAPAVRTAPVAHVRCFANRRPDDPVSTPLRCRARPAAAVARTAVPRAARAARPGPYRNAASAVTAATTSSVRVLSYRNRTNVS